VREEGALFVSPVRSRFEPSSARLASSTLLPSLFPPSGPSPYPPSYPSSPGKPSQPCVYNPITQISANLRFFLAVVFRRGLLLDPPGSCHPFLSPKGSVVSPRNPPGREYTHSTPPFCSRVDFVQDLYLKKPEVHKPAPKVSTPHVFTPVLNHSKNSFVTFVSLSLPLT
jgi:hypothetical protein